jgi:hypothetical protein
MRTTCSQRSPSDINHPIEGVARALDGRGSRKRRERPLTLRLLLHDPSYIDRLTAFLRSVGQQPRVSESGEIEVDAPDEELDAYLRVWQVMHPDAAVQVSP